MTDLTKQALARGFVAMSSREIADLTGKRHDNVMKDITYQLDSTLKDSSNLRNLPKSQQIQPLDGVTIFTDKRGYKTQIKLSRRHVEVLLLGYSVELRYRVMDEFHRMEHQLATWQARREEARMEHKPMTDAVEQTRDNPQWYHFANEADMINRIVLGMTAAQFKDHHGLPREASTRDAMTPGQVNAVQVLQKVNTGFILALMDFDHRKEILQGIFERNHRDMVIEEKLIEHY